MCFKRHTDRAHKRLRATIPGLTSVTAATAGETCEVRLILSVPKMRVVGLYDGMRVAWRLLTVKTRAELFVVSEAMFLLMARPAGNTFIQRQILIVKQNPAKCR